MHLERTAAALLVNALALLAARPASAGDLIYADAGEFFGSAGVLTTEDFEDEPTIGDPSSGAQLSIAFDHFTASSIPAALKVLDVPAFGNHNTTPDGVRYLSADTDMSMDADVSLTFAYPIDRLAFLVVDAEQGVDVFAGESYYQVRPGRNRSVQFFGIIAEKPFTEVFINVLNNDSHVSFDDIVYSPQVQGGCLIVIGEEVTCHEPGSHGAPPPPFTYQVEGMDACSGALSSYSFTASGGAAGEPFCFTLLITDEDGGICCSVERCVAVPSCVPPPVPADLDRDGSVSIGDLLALLARWGRCADHDQCPGDLDDDGAVGLADVLAPLAGWH